MANTEKKLNWLAGGGQMAAQVASKNWADTALGPIENWPASLRTTVSLCLASNFPINIIWGPQHAQIYNDGYKDVCGDAHPRALGESYTVTWASAWPAIGHPFEQALAGKTSFLENQRMYLERNGYFEETFFTFSLSPIRDETGQVVGLFHPVTETTSVMLSQRRTRALRDVAEKAGEAKTLAKAASLAMESLLPFAFDLPMALLYLVEDDGKSARLAEATPQFKNTTLAPEWLSLKKTSVGSTFCCWPFAEVATSAKMKRVSDIEKHCGAYNCGEYPEPLREAYIFPLGGAGSNQMMAFLILGMSTRLPMDESYTSFLTMLANTIGVALNNARVFEEEKKRAETLAELDRAKTAFFGNVSHEFRTPLTLMLGPLEDLLDGNQGALSQEIKSELQVVHRNALRLLKLVNALLDFSRIESNRIEASYTPTQLHSLTSDLASTFRSAIERAGMKFKVEVPDLGEAIFVDRDMWEKIVLNLLSNAFKYTLTGEIDVRLRLVDKFVEFEVQDSGIGIPETEVPKVFQRFHRVQGARGRTHEGTGIGLALVQELTKLHGGTVRVESQLGTGSRFIVRIPRGSAHLPKDQVLKQTLRTDEKAQFNHLSQVAFVEEAIRLIPENRATETQSSLRKKRILLADDNADMRDYVKKLLASRYEVETAFDGSQVIDLLKSRSFNLVLSDIMMPGMDGIELLAAIRSDPSLKTLPVILLSARAGDEAKATGIELGADDYLTKPFSAKELLARVSTQLRMAEVRQDAIENDVRNQSLKDLVKARDEFLSIASHELKTPITALKMQLELTQSAVKEKSQANPLQQELEKSFEMSMKQVARLSKIVEDLLDVSRLHAGKMTYCFESLSFGNFVRDVVTQFSEILPQNKKVFEVVVESNPIVVCDRFRMEQVVTNLLTNALKYGRGLPVKVMVSSLGAGRTSLSFTDHGFGIAPDKLTKIFERFERAIPHNNISGLGLGLYITKQIVDAHDGEIKIESSLGEGSVFTVELPESPANEK